MQYLASANSYDDKLALDLGRTAVDVSQREVTQRRNVCMLGR